MLPANPEFAEMENGDVILTLQLRHASTCGKRAVFVVFVFLMGWYGYVENSLKSRSGVGEKYILDIAI